MDGVIYIDWLMTLLWHHMNCKLSERNQPDFTQFRHYNNLMVDYVNELYESIFGFTKYVNWELSTNYMEENSLYGIVLLDKEGPESCHVEPVEGLTKSLHYLNLQ